LANINLDLSELLAPIRQMREEIQKMNDALRQTVQLQAQMAAQQRVKANNYGPTIADFAQEVRDRVVLAGGPAFPNNVYGIDTGEQVPPTNINPRGKRRWFDRERLPGGVDAHRSYLGAAQSVLSSGGVGIASALAGQVGYQNDFAAKKEREESIKLLSTSGSASAKILLDVSKKIEQERSIASENLKKATESYGKASEAGARDLAKFAKELDQAAKNFNKVNQKAEQFSETLDDWIKKGGSGPTGPTGGGPTLLDFFRNLSGGQKAALIAGAGVSAAGLAVSGFGAYMGMRGAGLAQDYSNTLAMSQAKSEIGALQRQNYFAMAAPRSGEEMLRAYGNLLAPTGTNYQYLGFQNRAKLEQDAKRLTETARSSELLQTGGALTEGAGGLITSAGGFAIGRVLATSAGQKLLQGLATRYLGSLAATAVTGPAAPFIAAGLTAYSAVDLVKSGYGLYRQYQEGMGTKVGQEFGGRFFGNDRLAIENQRYQRTLENLRNEELLRHGELGTFASRQMAMGLDEYIGMLRSRGAATSMVGGRAALGIEAVLPNLASDSRYRNAANQLYSSRAMLDAQKTAAQYAELGYTFNEAGNLKNTLLSVQQNVSSNQLLRAMQLTRAGVGSGEQIASGILGISAVSGKAGDLSQLERVFARAFSAGLRGSPEVQKFVQSSTETASALKLQSATGAANILSSVTAAMRGAYGSSLMYLGEAQKGISGFAATTGATAGLMGTLKVLSGAGAGLTSATGLGLLSGANAYQIQDAIRQIESGTPVEKMTGLARQMVGAQRFGGVSSETARASVLSVLKRSGAAIQMPFAAGFEMATGQTFTSIQSKAVQLFSQIGKGGKLATKAKESLKDLLSSYGSTMVGMGGADNIETAQAQFLASLPQGLIETTSGKRALEAEITRGQETSRSDFISVNYKKMLNKAAMQAVGKVSGPIGTGEIEAVAKSLGINTSEPDWYQRFQSKAMASGVDIKSKSQQQVSFKDLANIISAAGGEEMSKKSMIIEDISANALQRIQRALGRETVNTPEFFDGVPGPK
jgi:hypothetical protein